MGEKRKQLSDEQIRELVELYGAFEEGERVKIFRNERFGFQRITVERPLRLRWTGDGLRERLEASRGWPKLDDAEQAALLTATSTRPLAELSTDDRVHAESASRQPVTCQRRRLVEGGARRRCWRRSRCATRRRRR